MTLFQSKEKTAEVIVVNKSPLARPALYLNPTSVVDSIDLDPAHFTWTEFRYAERRENRHPDDHYLLLKCPVEVYTTLREGMRGTAVWKGNELLSFTKEME